MKTVCLKEHLNGSRKMAGIQISEVHEVLTKYFLGHFLTVLSFTSNHFHTAPFYHTLGNQVTERLAYTCPVVLSGSFMKQQNEYYAAKYVHVIQPIYYATVNRNCSMKYRFETRSSRLYLGNIRK